MSVIIILLCPQFVKPPPKVPLRSIGLAIILFIFGTVLLIVGSLLFTGHIDVKVRVGSTELLSKSTFIVIFGKMSNQRY